MFTGIIEEIGTVSALVRAGAEARVAIRGPDVAAALRLGESVAVDGACLTVAALAPAGFWADVSAETLTRTTLGAARSGTRVNLERPLRVGDRLGGHLVTGHVDGVGILQARRSEGAAQLVQVRFPRALAPLIALKGSIAVDGVSLTVASISGDTLGVALIPYTARGTTLGRKRPGDAVNLEADLIAKHLARLQSPGPSAGLTLDTLKEYGYA